MEKDEAITRIRAAHQDIQNWQAELHEINERHRDEKLFHYAGFLYPEHIKHMGKGAVVIAKSVAELVQVLPVVVKNRNQ